MYVPQKTHVSKLQLPTINPTLDSYQFIGSAIDLQSSDCQKPYSSIAGSAYCQYSCINTCPELNPNTVASERDQLAMTQSDLAFSKEASTVALNALVTETQAMRVSSNATFDVPSGTPTAAVNAALQLISQELVKSAPFALSASVCTLRSL